MTIQVGDQIANGKIVVAEVDTDDLIVSVGITALEDPVTHSYPIVSISPHQTVEGVMEVLGIVTGNN